jgi:hypothetical protein
MLIFVGLILIAGLPSMALAKPTPKPAPTPAKAPLCVERIHILYGCKTCEAMQDWLKKGGVKLEITDIQTGPFKLYPVVLYSDKTQDHGERMYTHEAAIPQTVCVTRCNVGTE